MTETQRRIDHVPEHFNPEELSNAFPSPRDLQSTDPLEAVTSAGDEKIIRPEEFGVAFSGLHAIISGAVDLTMSLCRVGSDIGKVVPAETKPALPRSDSVRSLNEMNMSGQYLEMSTDGHTV